MVARPVALTTRTGAKFICAFLAALAIGGEPARAQSSFGPQAPEEGVIRRQPWLIPAHDRVTAMRTAVFRPPGAGPFPLAVIGHGSPPSESVRAAGQVPQYDAVVQWLVARGYAVAVPQRPGH